jgi:hypothetical protein
MSVSLKSNLLSTHVGGVITTKSDFYGAYPIFHKWSYWWIRNIKSKPS